MEKCFRTIGCVARHVETNFVVARGVVYDCLAHARDHFNVYVSVWRYANYLYTVYLAQSQYAHLIDHNQGRTALMIDMCSDWRL